jgi:DNA recombination protein RmuC
LERCCKIAGTPPNETYGWKSETDIVRGAVEDQARGLRQELGRTLASFQDVTLKAFGTLRDGIDVQIRTFGERLDAGVKATGESVTTISTKLTHDMEQMRGEANTGRETLRGLIEQKLEQSIEQQTDSAKILREELGGNFDRLGIRVTSSLAETGQIQLPLSARCLKNRRRRRKACVSRWKAALTQFVKTMP